MRLDLRRLPLRPWSRFFTARSSACETFHVLTDDGVRLAVHRVRARPGADRRVPVMLLHGLGSNAHGFLLPQRSLAAYLADRGHECFIPELRGAGESENHGWTWDLEDYVTRDLPAIIAGIHQAAQTSALAWVGHSMGGILLCCYASRNADHGVKRGVCVGSALDYAAGRSAYARLHAMRRLVEWIPLVPFGPASHLLAPLLGRLPNPFEAFNFSRANVEPEVVRSLHAHGFEWIPYTLLASLATTFEPTGLCSRDGAFRYLECAKRFKSPVLLLGASRDPQCPLEAVHATARAIGANARVEEFGKHRGHAEDYGHFDLLVGRHAPDEVWPVIAAHLEAPEPADS